MAHVGGSSDSYSGMTDSRKPTGSKGHGHSGMKSPNTQVVEEPIGVFFADIDCFLWSEKMWVSPFIMPTEYINTHSIFN